MPETYFCWLIGFVGDGYLEVCYQRLLWKLFTTPFFFELDLDRNRAIDGLDLRKKFNTYSLVSPDPSLPTGEVYPCTILEMMIALSRRAEDNLSYDPDVGDSTGEWFYTILRNLELDRFDDYGYFEDDVDRILYGFMHHDYDFDGRNGGAFPCPGIDRDMRKTDLWWQLGAYFKRNYPIPIW